MKTLARLLIVFAGCAGIACSGSIKPSVAPSESPSSATPTRATASLPTHEASNGPVTPAATSGSSLLTGTPWPGWPTGDVACPASYLDMTLVTDPDTGIVGVSGNTGVHTTVVWPYGYSIRVESAGVALLDYVGNVLAYVGDAVRVGGGLMPDGTFNGCGGVDELPVATPD